MTDVDRLLADYIAEHHAGGEADPREYLSRASPEQRTELAALIDAYLARAPRQKFVEAKFRGSRAERTVDELERAIAGKAGLWPALLPQLRDRAGLKRSELVERLGRTPHDGLVRVASHDDGDFHLSIPPCWSRAVPDGCRGTIRLAR